MEKIFIYNGYMETNHNTILNILNSLVDASKIRDRYAADTHREIKYEDEKKDIYIYDDLNQGYLCQIELKGSLDEAQEFIDSISEKLRTKMITHQFEWSEVDENDNQIGEEYEITFPEN